MPINPKSAGWFLLMLFSVTQIYSKSDINHLGFGFENQEESVTIPFKSYNNLIILESVIDGKKKLNLILDTGIRSLILFDKSYVPKISEETFDIKFSGTGIEKPISAEVSINHNLRLAENVIANQINAVILKKSNNYLHELKGIKIHGVFGYQLFSRFQVKINYKNLLITISEPYKMDKIDGYESIPIVVHDTKPFVETHIATNDNKWQKLSLILDLGANHELLILDKSNVPNGFSNSTRSRRVAEGLSGSIYGINTIGNDIKLGSVVYKNTRIIIPTKETYQRETLKIEKHGSLGGRFFNKTTIVLDYINGYLFIEKT